MDNETIIWNYLISVINNAYGVAGLMGNLQAESGLNPINLENTFNKKFGMTDEQYTEAVDNGTYMNFINDSAGFGIAQWTFWSRKQNMYNHIKAKGLSIGDLQGQLEFLIFELSNGYRTVFNALKNANSIREASDTVLIKFENPLDKSESVKQKRESYGQEIYSRHVASSISQDTTPTKKDNLKFTPRTTAPIVGDKYYTNYKNGGINTCIVCGSNGYVLPNCVGYAHGRFLEIAGATKVNWKLPACNAEDWLDTAKANGMKTGNKPAVAAVVVWSKGVKHNGSDGAGHVAVIEQINSDGSILISESGYKSFIFRTRTLPYPYNLNGYKLEGFIYQDSDVISPTTPTPTPTPSYEDIYKVTTTKGLNVRKNAGVISTNPVIGNLRYNEQIEITEIWGYCPDKNGWVCMDYVEKVGK